MSESAYESLEIKSTSTKYNNARRMVSPSRIFTAPGTFIIRGGSKEVDLRFVEVAALRFNQQLKCPATGMKFSEKTKSRLYFVFLIIFLIVFTIVYLVYSRKVTGVSMLPTLEAGDLVIMENVPLNQVRAGDIVIFNNPIIGGCSDFTIIHRVVNITANGELITQGDDRRTNPTPDEPPGGPYVSQPCLVGKVIFVVPYWERLAELFPFPVNYILAFLIIIFVIYSEFGAPKAKESKVD